MTPVDTAIELKQNQALEFAIYYNKNMLPCLHLDHNSERFDLNSNANNKGFTPLHRAILNQNYKAIYLLLSSGMVNLLKKDRDFRSAKDYCQKVLFLFKYLRKGELNFVDLATDKAGMRNFHLAEQKRRVAHQPLTTIVEDENGKMVIQKGDQAAAQK